MPYLGDFVANATVRGYFNTRKANGESVTFAGTPALAVYKNNGTTEATAGVSLTVDFDSRTGLHLFTVDTSANLFYAEGSDYKVVVISGTVDSVSVVGSVVAEFSIQNRSKITQQEVRDSLKLSPSAGAATSDSIDGLLNTIHNHIEEGFIYITGNGDYNNTPDWFNISSAFYEENALPGIYNAIPTPQEIRDAMQLTPTSGDAVTIDEYLTNIETKLEEGFTYITGNGDYNDIPEWFNGEDAFAEIYTLPSIREAILPVTVVLDPQLILESQAKLLNKVLYFHNEEQAEITISLSDLEGNLVSFEGLTMVFCIEDRTRTDLAVVTDLETTSNALTITLPEIEPVDHTLCPLSWSLRVQDTKKVLGTGLAVQTYAPLGDT